MPHGIIQCYLPPGRGDIPALTPAEAGTRLSDPGGMQGRVDLELNTKSKETESDIFIIIIRTAVSTCPKAGADITKSSGHAVAGYNRSKWKQSTENGFIIFIL